MGRWTMEVIVATSNVVEAHKRGIPAESLGPRIHYHTYLDMLRTRYHP